MGRAPCCDKANVKKGPWSPEEDAKLKAYIEQHGTGGNWIALPQKIGLKRCGKSCRLRWLNYLRPNIKHGGFTEAEDNIICSLYISIGSRWSIIAAQLPGRTDNDVKNYWNTKLKRKLFGKQRKEHHAARRGNNNQKQAVKVGAENFVASSNDNNQRPYNWPDELPVLPTIPYSSSEEPRFKDHASVRKLLIKLGGRFSDDDQPIFNGSKILHQYPIDNNPLMQPSWQQPLNLMSSHQIDITNPAILPSPSTEYNTIVADTRAIIPGGESSLAAELEHVVCNNLQNLDGLEFFNGDLINHKGNAVSSRSTPHWGETNPLDFPSWNSSFDDGFLKGMLQQGCAFDELSYPDTQQ